MGKKVNPAAMRVNIFGWNETIWFSSRNYGKNVIEDFYIRQFIENNTEKGSVAKVVIERGAGRTVINIHTHKVGLIIGKNGVKINKLRDNMMEKFGKNIEINVRDLYRSESLDPKIIATSIAIQMENRMDFKRAAKTAMRFAMKAGAMGVKIILSGRLGGASICRTETYKQGSLPLHTFRNNVLFWKEPSQTIYGTCGVKVYVHLNVGE